MKNLIVSVLMLTSLSAFASLNQHITPDIQVEFTCIIPGHGGGCSVETYFFNSHPETVFVKVFTSFIENGELQTSELETTNTNSIKLITSKNFNEDFTSNSIMIGKKKTVINVLYFDVNGYLIDSKKEVLHASFSLEY